MLCAKELTSHCCAVRFGRLASTSRLNNGTDLANGARMGLDSGLVVVKGLFLPSHRLSTRIVRRRDLLTAGGGWAVACGLFL